MENTPPSPKKIVYQNKLQVVQTVDRDTNVFKPLMFALHIWALVNFGIGYLVSPKYLNETFFEAFFKISVPIIAVFDIIFVLFKVKFF